MNSNNTQQVSGSRVRRDIRDLQREYDNGNKTPLETLIRAFRGISALPSSDPNSFFVIGGYHGEPFRGAGWGNSQWWGGYCNHGNVLFPVWHRAHLLRLEDALRSVDGCSDVTLPYWNEIDDETKTDGLPTIFTQRTFQLDDKEIPNPLYSYHFIADVTDNLSPFPDADYSKPKGYPTVRYPFSGLVGPKDVASTTVHNDNMNALGDTVTNGYLNDNVKDWLNNSTITNDRGKSVIAGTRDKFWTCLDAPNYTIFSNTTSATQWNDDNFIGQKGPTAVVPLESPHNDIHLAIGGFELPKQKLDADGIPGANGDMGENDTAAFDPIFFFHHCFIDRMFWSWQKKWQKTTQLDVIQGYPGTNSVDNQGPTPGVAGNIWLDMNSPLAPFTKPNGQTYTGNDVTDLNQLGYQYDTIVESPVTSPTPGGPTPTLRISGINRGAIGGSFLLSTWAKPSPNANKQLVHVESVLSRWHVQGCANCNTHLNVKTFVPLHGWGTEAANKAEFETLVHTRDNRRGSSQGPNGKQIKPVLGAIGA